MSIHLQLLNRLITIANRRTHGLFMAATHDVEAVQRRQLGDLATSLSATQFSRERGLQANLRYEDLCALVPVSTYADWQVLVRRQMTSGEAVLSPGCHRYQPTSGSTSASKWVPYSPKLLSEFDAAIGPWLYGAAKAAPSLQKGRHYWSLSWLPDEQREAGKSTNDQELLPWWKAAPMAMIAAAPASISQARTCDDAMFATAAHLVAARDLSLMSVWSPTFALALFSIIARGAERLAIIDALESGSWGARAANLQQVPCPKDRGTARFLREWHERLSADGSGETKLPAAFFRELWPQLAFVSAWDSANSKAWAAELRGLLAHAHFQGKGLWATEGVVTFPLSNQLPLAITSHFYEFRLLPGGDILPAWKLREGMEVQPILTTGSGLWRYQLQDRLLVTGFLNRCPCLGFIGRLSGTDMVGEKLESALIQALLDALSHRFGVKCLGLFARETPGQLPGYTLLAAGQAAASEPLAAALELGLSEHFHYRLARQLGQLAAANAVACPEGMAVYIETRRQSGILPGDIKVEPLLAGDVTTALARVRVSQTFQT